MAGFGAAQTRIAHAVVAIVDVVIAALVLQALCRLSSWTSLSVSVDGFWTSLGTTELMTAVKWGRQVPTWQRLEALRYEIGHGDAYQLRFDGLIAICLPPPPHSSCTASGP